MTGVQTCALPIYRAEATAEEAAQAARRRGAKIWLAYAEGITGGPESAVFKRLIDETGARLLAGLRIKPSA